MSWEKVAIDDPGLAARGAKSLRGLCYLATTKKDGSPRLHPVVPLLGEGRIFVFMEPTSPKGHDLRHDGRYALHSSVEPDASSGELLVTGRAQPVEEPAAREFAACYAHYPPPESDVLFEFGVESVLWTSYDGGGRPVRKRWKAS